MPKPSSKFWIDFTALRARARFEPVLDHYRVAPQGRGPQKTLLCPFHEETEPSCKVNLEKRAFHCFGCGAKGNVLDFVAKMENAELPEAARRLAEICGIPLAEVSRTQTEAKPRRTRAVEPHRKPQEPREHATTRKTAPAAQPPLCEPPGEPEAAPGTLSELKLLTRGRSTLNLPPLRDAPGEAEGPINPPLTFRLKLDAAHPYLAERGVSLEIAEAFGLGYCSRGMMQGRICIPIHNEAGELVAYAGRWPGDSGWPAGEERYKLPPGFRKSHVLFNLNRVPDDDWHVVLVEGFFSVFRLYAMDVPAVALMGCSLSDEQIELLARRTKRITVLTDGDAAGRAARAGIVPRLAERLDVYAPLLPEGTSPDTLDDDVLVGLISADPLP